MRGQVALMLTNKGKEEMEKHLADHETVDDFATAGTKATYTVFLPKGKEALEGFTYSMEGQFKDLGLPVKLDLQKIELLSDVYVCREGQVLNVEQAKLLKLLGHRMAKFTLTMLCQRSAAKKGKFREFDAGRVFLAKYAA